MKNKNDYFFSQLKSENNIENMSQNNQDNQEITIQIKLFAIYQETYKTPEIIVKVSKNTTIKELFDNIIVKEKPELKRWENITRFAVNLKFVQPNYILQHHDEVAFIPPVSGG